jgi:peptidoglycan/LPS O-acetylase OafA/YrhL
MTEPGPLQLPAKRRLEFLDALRGLAAAYVIVYHMLLLPNPHLVPPKWAETFALAGGTGVTLFFIVSSFSLYYTMPLRLREKSPTFSFYLHRFFRIAPLFYFLMVATLIRDIFVFHATHGIPEILASALFLFNFIPTHQEGFVWAGWTIGVEMVFYAVFPLIYGRIRKTGDAIAFVFACLLAWMAIQMALDYIVMPDAWRQSILQWSAFKHFPIFAIGIVVYQVFMGLDVDKLHAGGYRSAGNALLLGGIFGFCALLQGWLPAVFGNPYYWQGVIFALLFLGLALAPWRAIVNRGTRFLGKISYSVYLNHTTAILFLTPVLRWYYAHSPSLTVAFLASLATVLAVVLPVSYLTYRFIEEPGINFGKKAAGWFKARHEAANNAVQIPEG